MNHMIAAEREAKLAKEAEMIDVRDERERMGTASSVVQPRSCPDDVGDASVEESSEPGDEEGGEARAGASGESESSELIIAEEGCE